MAETRVDCDVLVVGGGLVGLTLGLALAREGIETAVADALDPARVRHAAFDGRVSAIAYSSCRMLKTLGLWEHVREEAQPILDIVVSDGTIKGGASPLFMHFDHREIGDAPLGHMVENRHLRIAQQKAAEGAENLRVLAPARVTRAEFHAGHVEAGTDTGVTIRAALCAAADGRHSPLRALAGIKTIAWSYAQTGIVSCIAHERAHEGVAQEYFLPSGPFAILPMKGNRSSLVWTERAELAPSIMAMGEEDFAREARARVTDFLGAVRPVGPRWSYPLSLTHARNYVAPRLALVGDAAHAIHPIAGQGFNLGLRDVAALAEVLGEAARLGLDPGQESVLAGYERWRRFDNTMLCASTDLLNRLFSNDVSAVRLARDLGLAAVNAISPLKRFFMRHAGGDLGALPGLLSGEKV